MRDLKTTRKKFIKGLGLAALATGFSSGSAAATQTEKKTDDLKLPMDARKAPKAVARSNASA